MPAKASPKRVSPPRASKRDASDAATRLAIVETARAMARAGLAPGRSGNVSARAGPVASGGMLITPSGMAYDDIGPADIVHVGPKGEVEPGARKPSSEWLFHLAVYRARADAGAVVHCHSLNATVLACAHQPIPAFHYMVAAAGGSDIPLVPYATFGTEALAAHVAKGLHDRNACLMANHGQIALGATLGAALELAQEVETLAAQYVKVLSLGRAHVLSDAEMAEVLERFKSYGQKGQD